MTVPQASTNEVRWWRRRSLNASAHTDAGIVETAFVSLSTLAEQKEFGRETQPLLGHFSHPQVLAPCFWCEWIFTQSAIGSAVTAGW